MSKLLEIALSQIGVKEIKGTDDNPTIVNYAKESGFEWVNDDETPWCSIFINWCAKKANLQGSNKANARSWLTTGGLVSNPEPGDIVVFWRIERFSWTGHVGLFMGYDQSGERIYTLGGNQGNQVSISAYSAHQLLGFRRLNTKGKADLPKAPLKQGDTGEEVKQLQDALKNLGFEVGTSDGIYGPKTRDAVKAFQASESLLIDGIYGKKTASQLKKLSH